MEFVLQKRGAHMDIRSLKYFIQVAKEQNFTKAASKLYISQPALSKTIKKLEQEMNMPLFDIRTSGVYLTDYGQFLYDRAIPIIGEFDALSNCVNEVQSMQTGELRIGVTPIIATLYMVDIVVEFSNCWPKIELKLMEHGSKTLRTMLHNGEIDLAVCIDGDYIEGLKDTVLFQDEMVAILSSEHALAHRERLHFEELKDEVFNFYSTSSSLHRQITERCIRAGFIPQKNIVSTKVNFIMRMTENNRGICILPRPYAVHAYQNNPRLKAVPFTEPFPWTGCIVHNELGYQSYLSRFFESYVVDAFQSQAWLEKKEQNESLVLE